MTVENKSAIINTKLLLDEVMFESGQRIVKGRKETVNFLSDV